jgi:queuosine precursor transporter
MSDVTAAPAPHAEVGPAYARTTGHYATVVAAFVGMLIISNIGATKLIAVGPLITDGGAFLFPLVYVLGDVLSEVYGWRATRRAILLGFGMSALAALTFLAVQHAPAADDWPHQAAFEAVLGFVPRIVVASLAGFVVGQLLNAWVLVRIKARTHESRLWLRLLGSTAVGEFADTLVFCTVAFYGVITGWTFVNYVVTGYLYKVAVEVLVMPVTYRVIALVKRHEPTYGVHEEPQGVPAAAA